MHIRLFLVSALLFSLVPSQAQDETPPDEATQETAGPRRFWQASLPGGHYMVALNRITSVSRHQYLLDGTLIVDEVTIDTAGQSLARFYAISPINVRAGAAGNVLADRAADLIDRAGQHDPNDLKNMVIKKYPETTHARSIEYRLVTPDELGKLYDSVRKAWESGRGSQFKGK